MSLVEGLFFVEMTLEFELFLFFFAGRRRTEKNQQKKLINILGLYFLLLAIGRGLLIYYDFYSGSTFYYNLGTGISLLGMICFIYLAENIIPKNTHYIFTILSCATSASIFFVDLQTAKTILYVMIPLIFLIGFVFLGYLIRNTSGSVRYNFILVFFGQVFFGIGQGLNNDWIRGWFLTELGFDIQLVGLLAIIGGLALIALAFWRLPSFSELEWHSKLRELFVITNAHGICCVHFAFKEPPEDSVDSDLISSGVTGIISLIKELTSSKMQLKEVDHEDIKMIFEYGQYTTTALLAEESLQIYHHKLRKFVEQFEKEFNAHLIKWTGSMNEFIPAIDIVARVFEQKLEKNESLIDVTAHAGTF